jgi:hypothetical protein
LFVGCKNSDRLIAEYVKLGIKVLLMIRLEKVELDEDGVFNVVSLIFKFVLDTNGF